MISDDDVTRVVAAARLVPPAVGDYLETGCARSMSKPTEPFGLMNPAC